MKTFKFSCKGKQYIAALMIKPVDIALDEWDESKHPRADNGQFGCGNGKKKEKDDMDKENYIDFTKFLDTQYNDVRGYEAINKLRQEQKGFVRDAFSREDTGEISLFWGDEHSGLCHIIKRRENQNIDVDVFLQELTNVIEKGKLIRTNEKGRYEIFYDKKMAVIEPELTNGKLTFLLTAFKRRKP